jgi:Fe2+ or Zn2+ uptake regulation protein
VLTVTTALHEDVATRLRRSRQRYTGARRRLVELLQDLDRPRSIAELLEADPSLSQSSLYRNMSVLEQARVVRRLAGPDDVARFELAEDVTGDHHHHLVCSTCGRIDDVDVGADVEQAVHDAVDRALEAHGFTTDLHRLELVGTCAACA